MTRHIARGKTVARTALFVGSLFLLASVARAISPEELKKIQAAIPAKATVQPKKPRKLLNFMRGKGLVHTSIPYGTKAIELMGEKTGAYETFTTDDPEIFRPEKLKQFDAICFNNSNRMDFFKDPELQKSLLDFVRGGKGVMAIHAATTNFCDKFLLDWPEGAELLGAIFVNHPWRGNDTVTIKLDDPGHPLNAAFGGKGFEISDEIYTFLEPYSRDKLRVLMSLDVTKTDMTKNNIKRDDGDFAVSWVRSYGKGRVFYGSLGHEHHVFWNPAILRHYLDGFQFALGDLEADTTPSAQLSKKKRPGKKAKTKKSQETRELSWRRTDSSLALLNNGRVVWQFNYDKKEDKPYFHPVALTDGTVLTWHRPPDHIWHRALWFSWKYVNHVNYWEENKQTGLSEGRSEVMDVKAEASDDYSARFELRLAYHPDGKPTVLTEKRTIAVGAPDERGNYLMDWTCEFTAGDADVVLDRTPPPGQEGGKSFGGYAGLSARLAEDLTDFQILNSEGQRDADAHGQPARWCDFSALTPAGRPAGIAILDHPANPRHPTPWYISKKGPKKNNFSSAPIFHKPLTLPAGESLTLRYRVLVHSGFGNQISLGGYLNGLAAW